MTLPATLPLEAAGQACWDAVVVGAGPAGALAAWGLARQGAKVLLVDRASFPRWKVCGCCLNAAALGTLRDAGLGELPRRCGAVPLRRLRLAARGCEALVSLPGGAALSRETLDAALVERAVQAGVAFLPQTQASFGDLRPGERTVLVQQGEVRAVVAGRLILAATGLGGALPGAEEGLALQTLGGARIGAGALAPAAPAFYTPGTIFMACGQGGYAGLVRLEDGRLAVAAALDPVLVRGAGGPGAAVAGIFAQVRWPALPDRAELSWRGTPTLTRRLLSPAAERLFVLGDAAGYVEPFTGEGMAWALAAAVAVTPLALQAIRRWEAPLAGAWADLYRRTVGRRQRACRLTAAVLRRPHCTRVLLHLLACVPALAAPFLWHLNAASPREKGRRP